MWKLAPETQSKRSKLFAVSLGARSALAPSGLCPVCFGRGLPFALTDFFIWTWLHSPGCPLGFSLWDSFLWGSRNFSEQRFSPSCLGPQALLSSTQIVFLRGICITFRSLYVFM